MIVWNVEARWFATKAEAEIHRKGLKLKPYVTRRAEVRNRDELVSLIDGRLALPELHRSRVRAEADPGQLALFDAGEEQRRTVAAIRMAGFPPQGDPAYGDPPAGHLETYEQEPEGLPPHDPDTGEVIEEGPP